MSFNQHEQSATKNVRSNKFEEPLDQRNDLIDSGVGFVVSFVFFMAIFFIFVLFEAFGKLT